METVKEKLAKLINEAKEYHISECVKMLTCAECSYKGTNCKALHKAEYLIQNGVTIHECGMDCKNCWKTKLVNPMQEWVSVDERLPEETGKYIVCTAKNTVYLAKYYSNVKHFGIEAHTHITHWMPLPAPPKGVK